MAGAAAALFAMGAVGWTGNAPIQSRLIELAPQGGGLVLSLNASAIYLGAGLSGVVGGLVIAWLGVLALPLVAAAIGLGSLLVLLLALRQDRSPATPPRSADRRRGSGRNLRSDPGAARCRSGTVAA